MSQRNKLIEWRIGSVVSNDTIVALTDEINAWGSRLVLVRCNLCEVKAKVASSYLNRKSVKRKCLGCAQKKIDDAKASPLVLTDRQWKSVFWACKNAAYMTFGPRGLDLVDDITSDTCLKLLLKSDTIRGDPSTLAFVIAKNVVKARAWGNPGGPRDRVVEGFLDEDGVWHDVVHSLPAIVQNTDERERRQLAFDDIPSEDKTWMLKHLRHGRKDGQDRFEQLAAKVRDNYAQFEAAQC